METVAIYRDLLVTKSLAVFALISCQLSVQYCKNPKAWQRSAQWRAAMTKLYEENWTEGHYATWRSEVAFAIFGLHL